MNILGRLRFSSEATGFCGFPFCSRPEKMYSCVGGCLPERSWLKSKQSPQIMSKQICRLENTVFGYRQGPFTVCNEELKVTCSLGFGLSRHLLSWSSLRQRYLCYHYSCRYLGNAVQNMIFCQLLAVLGCWLMPVKHPSCYVLS